MKKHLKDYFIPHQGNDYKPHSLQKAAMIGMASLVALTFFASNLHAILWTTSDWLVSTVLPSVIVELTNEERETSSLSSLKRNSVLDEAAELKAEHMARNQYFAHYSPDGVSPWHWFGVADYNFVHAGENLAIHFTDSDDVVKAWMDSPTHRANIMNGDYSEIGVGTAKGTYEGFDTVYVVQLFGTPSAPVAATAPAPVSVPEPVVAAESIAVETESEPVVAAESVEILEEVEFIEPEPIPVVVKNEPEPTEVMDMEVTENSVALYSDHLATTTGGVPATVLPNTVDQKPKSQTNFVGEIATQPHLLMQMLYFVIALFVIGSLLLSILIEIRRQQPLQIAYGVALLLLMYGLYQMHELFTGGVLIV